MKVRLNPLINMSTKEKKELNEYMAQRAKKIYDEEATGLVRRCYKTFAVVLHQKHGFGRNRLLKVMEELADISKLRDIDDVFWKHLDDIIINEIKLDFEREDYKELEE